MTKNTAATDEATGPSVRVIRDKAFAKRLETAVLDNPKAPDGHGKQKWLLNALVAKCNRHVSTEAVRKWFAGESRPRPPIMAEIARVLEVDEAWLSLGIEPDMSPREERERNAVASGAVNYVAGLVQMNGGHIAFPSDDDRSVDLHAIIGGKKHDLSIRTAPDDASMVFTVPVGFEKRVVVGVVSRPWPATSELLRFPPEVIKSHGRRKGSFLEVTVTRSGQSYTVDGEPLGKILSFDNLDGVFDRRAKSAPAAE